MRIEINKHNPILDRVAIVGIAYEWKIRVVVIWVVFWAARITIC
jgi:hypothetical protein